jgi:peptidoglycan/LPS O-acetylase OafA/YrhL
MAISSISNRLGSHRLLKAWSILCLVLHHLTIIFPRRLRPAHGNKDLHPTAYLDAVRGFAAWIVYNGHIFDTKHWQPTTFPKKLFIDGIAMVDLFFVISGFALTFSILGAVHRGDSIKALDSLGSSIFRRYVRLYLPVAFATFITMLVIASGVGVLRIPETATKPLQPTFSGNVWFWLKDTVRASNPFAHVNSWWQENNLRSAYLSQMWTIPVEFRGSIIVFVFCVAVCKMKPWARTATIWTGMCASFWWQTPYGGLFLAGMWLADRRQWKVAQEKRAALLPMERLTLSVDDVSQAMPLTAAHEPEKYEPEEDITMEEKEGEAGRSTSSVDSLLVEESQPLETSAPQTWVNRWTTSHGLSSPEAHPNLLIRLLRSLTPIAIFTFSLYILTGGPKDLKSTSRFPFSLISHTVPPTYSAPAAQHWHLSIGAIWTVYSLELFPLLRRPFETAFSQYIGELSFGIYAMHVTVRCVLWERVFLRWQREWTGQLAGEKWWCFVPGYVVLTVLVLWAAELFRIVDARCVRFSKWLGVKMFTG